MYRTNNHNRTVMRFGMAALTAVFMIVLYGCGESKDSTSANPVGPQTPAETIWDASRDIDVAGEFNTNRPEKPRACIYRKESYVTFQNRFHCEAVDVLVDHKVIARLEPDMGITAALKSGKHALALARAKGGKVLKQSIEILEPCDELLFATEHDICADAIE